MTQKVILDTSLLNTQQEHFKSKKKKKRSNPGKGVAPSLHLGVVAIEKGALEYSRQLYFYINKMVSKTNLLSSVLT